MGCGQSRETFSPPHNCPSSIPPLCQGDTRIFSVPKYNIEHAKTTLEISMMMDQGQDFVVHCNGRRRGMLVRNQVTGDTIALCKRTLGGYGIYKVNAPVFAGQPCSMEDGEDKLFRYARVLHRCKPGHALASVQFVHERTPTWTVMLPLSAGSGNILDSTTQEVVAEWAYQSSTRLKTVRMLSNTAGGSADVGVVLCLCLISEFVWKDMEMTSAMIGSG